MSPESIALVLLRSGAVLLRPEAPFTFASGIRSPIYCDNRLLLGDVPARREVAAALLAAARQLPCDVVAGVVSAGVPWAAWLAEGLERPMAYVRGAAKEHGRGNQIEGRTAPGQQALLVEDLVSTGGSSLAAAEALRAQGLVVRDALCIFSYGMAAASAGFAAAGIALRPLTTLPVLLEVAAGAGFVAPQQQALVAAWAADPQGWTR